MLESEPQADGVVVYNVPSLDSKREVLPSAAVLLWQQIGDRKMRRASSEEVVANPCIARIPAEERIGLIDMRMVLDVARLPVVEEPNGHEGGFHLPFMARQRFGGNGGIATSDSDEDE